MSILYIIFAQLVSFDFVGNLCFKLYVYFYILYAYSSVIISKHDQLRLQFINGILTKFSLLIDINVN